MDVRSYNYPSPTDLLDLLIDSVITNLFNINKLSEYENLKHIANFTVDGKKILIEIVAGFNFYFEHYYNFLSSLHTSMVIFDKEITYSAKKTQLIETILIKLTNSQLSFDRNYLTNKIGNEDLL